MSTTANRIKKKYLDSNSVDGSKVLFMNEESFRAKNSSSEDIELFKLSSQNKFTLLKLPSVAIAPTDMYDIVNKKYVDDEVYAEKSRAMMAESELEGMINAEESRAIAREDELEDMIDAEALTRTSEDIRVLNEAKDYTDSEIASNVTSKLAQPNGIATLDSNGKLSSSQIPALAAVDVYVVTTIAERDALTVQEGDIVKVVEAVTASDGVTKLPRTYIYDGSAFIELNTESDVDSVNGKVGHVVLNTSDISESGDNRYFTPSREQDLRDYTDMEVSEEAAARAAEDETLVKLDGSRPMTGDLNMGGQSITNVQEIVPPLNEDGFPISPVHIRELSSDDLEVTDTLSTPTIEGVYNEQAGRSLLTLGSSIYMDAYDITGLDMLQGDGSNDIEVASSLDMTSNRIKNLPMPLSSDEAATKGYVDSEVGDKLGQPNGIATLDSNGKLSSSQIPSITISDVFVVTTLTQRDALSVETGDVAKVTEAIEVDGQKLPRTYIYDGSAWIDVISEGDVDTVNGQVGTVVLDTDDISEGTSNKYFTDTRAKTAAVVNTLSGSETDQAPSVSSVKSYVANSLDEFGQRYQVDSFTVDSTIIAQNYIELSSKAFSMTIVPSIDRLLLLEGDDYTVSVVGGKTRLTFANSVLPGGEEALEVGDKIRIRYLKDLSV